MVKLRLPRSPFHGMESSSSSSANSGGTRRSRRIQNRRMQPPQPPQQQPQQLGVAAMENADETERRPDNHDNNNENSLEQQQSGRSSLRRMFASPGKRKPEGRGITASIRRARTTTSQTTAGAAAPAVASSQLRLDMDEDAVDGGVLRERNNTEDTVLSQEENKNGVPPLSLLSPNSGTFYAHAAAHDAMEIDDVKVGGGGGSTTMTKNVLQWMKDDAPPELLPRILSFCGSRRLCALSKVNRKWNSIINDESIWRVMCEDTHKWTNDMQMPESWSDFYRENPCVPVDYDTLESAFDSISSGASVDSTENNVRQRFRMQNSSARVLLHPGPYFLRKPIVFNCIGSAEITIESIGGLKDPRHALTWCQNYHAEPPIDDDSTTPKLLTGLSSSETIDSSEETKRPSSATLRQIFGCRSTCAALSTPRRGAAEEEEDDADVMSPDDRAKFHKSSFEGPNPTAVVVFESSKQNQAIFRVRQGIAHIKGLKLLHYCEGVDIWNGNAAIQVQSPFAPNGRQIRVQPPSVVPTAYVSDCDIVSLSGRGVVNIDGGISHVNKCFIHNSAATGLYLGGRGSKVTMTETDVVENGNGNERNNRGVSRGHSGIYIEQGTATIRDCNISKNSLTGISAVSTDHSTLQVESSCLQSNGSIQVELPPIGSPSRRRSYSRNNTISTNGHGRARSRFARALELPNSPHPIGRHFPPLPQSPSEFPDDVVLRR